MDQTNLLLRQTPVAIVGMASIFADAPNLSRFWHNIVQGVDSIREVPDSRWKISDYYDANPAAADKTYCKVGGFLPEIDFNPLEFGLPPALLEATDTAQLLSLAVARDALADAGYAPGSTQFTEQLRARTGVILGVGGGQSLLLPLSTRLEYPVWRRAMEAAGLPEAQISAIVETIKAAYIPWTEDAFPGLLGNVVAGRIANRLDLGGINSVVDAACAASLSALKMALSELVERRCDMMLTGGVDTNNTPFMYMSFSKTPAFSRRGSIRPFDQDSDGMLIGEGLGMVVCKRLEDAVRDGDRVYAVIRGIGASSDGRYKSIYAPRPQGQALAMQRAYDEAGYDASSVGLLEAHGTGTTAGDLSEIESVKSVFGKSNLALHHIALGSVKSQIGHTKAAAGVAGLIKAALALHHKVLPATINVTQPNPKLGLAASPLYINTQHRPWFRKAAQLPRRAGVSAFGFGGINLHTTLEEFNDEPAGPYRPLTLHYPVLLHAASTPLLLAACQQAQQELQADAALLPALSQRAAGQPVPAAHPRLGFVATSAAEAGQKLSQAIEFLEKNTAEVAWTQPLAGIWYRVAALAAPAKVAALFAGQGAQYPNMGNELACTYPVVRRAFEQANRFFEAGGQPPLTNVVFPVPVFSEAERQTQAQQLTQTQFAQPAIGALSAGMYRLLAEAGFRPDFYAGHSYGELTALWAAGALSDDAFFGLSKIRGEAMAAAPGGEAGGMLAIKAGPAAVEPLLAAYPGAWLANLNSPAQVVVGGHSDELTRLLADVKNRGLSATLLPVSAAFHTPLVAHAQPPLAAAVQRVAVGTFAAPVYSNATGQPYPTEPAQVQKLLVGHLLQPVRFGEQIENLYAQGARVFVEFGPRAILSGLVAETLAGRPHTVVALNPSSKKDGDKQLREAVVQLAVLGLPPLALDQAAQPVAAPAAKPKLVIKISGYNHISAATHQRYADALAATAALAPGTSPVVGSPVAAPPAPAASSTVPSSPLDLRDPIVMETLVKIQADLAAVLAQQSRIETLLQKWLQADKPAPPPVAHPALTTNGLSNNNGAAKALAYQGANGSAYGNGHAANGAAVPAPLAPAVGPTPPVAPAAPVASGLAPQVIANRLLAVVADKTGYPAEMLELSMDMEADLGIDSIKRVEIFGTMTEAHPAVQDVKPQELAELRTLQQIVDYLGAKTSGSPGAPAAPVAAAAPATANGHAAMVAPVAPAAPAASGVAPQVIADSLLAVVADKTGYPAEMLELSMDMEADLGIDSIKRVEIFGTMTEAHPAVQDVKPQELAELRTLQQIVNYLVTKTATGQEDADAKK